MPVLRLDLHKGSYDTLPAPTMATGQSLAQLQCNVTSAIANYMIALYTDYLNKTQAYVTSGFSSQLILDDLITAIPVFGSLLSAAIQSVATTATIGIAVAISNFDTAFKEDIKCALLNAFISSGIADFTPEVYASWKANMIALNPANEGVGFSYFMDSVTRDGKQLIPFRQKSLIFATLSADCSACPPAWTETLTIPADGTRVPTVHSTIVGQNYNIVISGTCIVYNRGDGFYVQGDGYWRENTPGDWSDNDVRVQLNDVYLSPIQAYTNTHVYNLVVPGTGSPLSFAEVGANLGGNPTGNLTIQVTPQ